MKQLAFCKAMLPGHPMAQQHGNACIKKWVSIGQHRSSYRLSVSNQMLLRMKLISIFLLLACLQIHAKSISQKVTIQEKNVSFEKVIKTIEKQTGVRFFYRNELLQQLPNVSVSVTNVNMEDALRACFKNLPVTYNVVNGTIVILPRKETVENNNAPPIAFLSIKGKVTDENGKPLSGSTVYIKGKGLSATVDETGSYAINANVGDILVFSFVGYKTREIKITDRFIINISLEPENSALKEVIIATGYGQKKASEVTGSLQKIDGEELRQGVSGANTLAMLKGKASGLYIVENGGSVASRGQVVMRGQASMPDQSNSNFGPLIVIDGVITTAANLQDIVDPNDIESVTILKDAASTAIYGSRAAQGVVVVITRHGANAPMKISLSTSYGQVQNNRLVNYMNTPQLTAHINKYMQAMYAGSTSLQNTYGSFQNYFNTTRVYTDAELNNDYDWSNHAFFTDGRQSNVNLSVSGGNDKTKMYATVGWQKQDGTLLDDNLDRKTFRINVDQKITDRLSFSLNSNVLIDKYRATTSETQSYLFLPWVTPYYANGQLADSVPNYQYRSSSSRGVQWYDDPLYSHSYNTKLTTRQSYLGTGKLKYNITPWLSVQSSNTFQYIDNNVNAYTDPRTYRGRYDGPASNRIYLNGSLTLNDAKTNYFLTSNTLNFNKRFGQHNISALVGEEYSKTHVETVAVSAYNTPYPGERNLGAFLNFGDWINVLIGMPATPTSAASVDKASFSMFGEVNDSYKDKYFASASLRRDASTNFGRNNRYGTFYSLSGGWLLSKESFMQTVKPITNLKLRAAYGTSGREAGADYLNFTVYTDAARYNDLNTYGSTIQRLGNDQITWETTYTTNLGLDVSFWKRIHLSVDVYNRRSSGLLQTVSLPSYIGFSTQIRNIGELTNKGVELMLSTVNVQTKNFKWIFDGNISFNQNKLTSIYGDSLKDGYSGGYYRYIGEDINVLKAVRYVGVNPDNGRPLFEKVNADKTVTIVDSIPLAKQAGLRNYQTMGSATPKFYGGFTNTFVYKNITMSMLFNFSYGNKIMNNSLRSFLDPTSWQSGFNLPAPDKNQHFWSGPGDNTANYPNFYDLAFNQRGAANIASSLLYQDASYLRLRNIRLAYDLPQSLLKKMHVSSFNVYVSADNVFVIKSKELYAADPEGSTIGSTSNSYGGTGNYSAMPRRLLFGINVSF